MAISVSGGLKIGNKDPVDDRIVKETIDEALLISKQYSRYQGLKIFIKDPAGDGSIPPCEYWFRDGVEDTDFIKLEVDGDIGGSILDPNTGETVGDKFEEIDDTISGMEEKLEEIDDVISGIEDKLEEIDDTISGIEEKLDRIPTDIPSDIHLLIDAVSGAISGKTVNVSDGNETGFAFPLPTISTSIDGASGLIAGSQTIGLIAPADIDNIRQYINKEVSDASLATEKWKSAVNQYADLAVPTGDEEKQAWLCRVLKATDDGSGWDPSTSTLDPTKAPAGVYQWVGTGATEWTYFGDNQDFIDDLELAGEFQQKIVAGASGYIPQYAGTAGSFGTPIPLPSWNNLSGMPAVVAAGANAESARNAISGAALDVDNHLSKDQAPLTIVKFWTPSDTTCNIVLNYEPTTAPTFKVWDGKTGDVITYTSTGDGTDASPYELTLTTANAKSDNIGVVIA
jgi:hypothetical protein